MSLYFGISYILLMGYLLYELIMDRRWYSLELKVLKLKYELYRTSSIQTKLTKFYSFGYDLPRKLEVDSKLYPSFKIMKHILPGKVIAVLFFPYLLPSLGILGLVQLLIKGKHSDVTLAWALYKNEKILRKNEMIKRRVEILGLSEKVLLKRQLSNKPTFKEQLSKI